MKMKQIKKKFHFGARRDQAKTWKQECTWGVLGALMRLILVEV